VTLASLDEQRQVKHSQSTGLKSLTLYKNEEVSVLFDKCDSLAQGYTSFQKYGGHLKIIGAQRGDTQQVPHLGPINM
jgi:hypothetical protein